LPSGAVAAVMSTAAGPQQGSGGCSRLAAGVGGQSPGAVEPAALSSATGRRGSAGSGPASALHPYVQQPGDHHHHRQQQQQQQQQHAPLSPERWPAQPPDLLPRIVQPAQLWTDHHERDSNIWAASGWRHQMTVRVLQELRCLQVARMRSLIGAWSVARLKQLSNQQCNNTNCPASTVLPVVLCHLLYCPSPAGSHADNQTDCCSPAGQGDHRGQSAGGTAIQALPIKGQGVFSQGTK